MELLSWQALVVVLQPYWKISLLGWLQTTVLLAHRLALACGQAADEIPYVLLLCDCDLCMFEGCIWGEKNNNLKAVVWHTQETARTTMQPPLSESWLSELHNRIVSAHALLNEFQDPLSRTFRSRCARSNPCSHCPSIDIRPPILFVRSNIYGPSSLVPAAMHCR